jgi:hypothetical protein
MIWFFDFEAKRQAQHAARKDALRQALVGYPLYDPPHKVEERRLPPDKAEENFDYFMNVRNQRLAAFREWVESKFGVRLALDRNGAAALCDWSGLYGDLLFETHDDLDSYSYYTKPWVGDCIGSNVVFDMATFMGEALIDQCPKLFWDAAPFVLPYDAKLVLMLKKDKGSGFQRPTITGFRNPHMNWDPFLEMGNYTQECWFFIMTPGEIPACWLCLGDWR